MFLKYFIKEVQIENFIIKELLLKLKVITFGKTFFDKIS